MKKNVHQKVMTIRKAVSFYYEKIEIIIATWWKNFFLFEKHFLQFYLSKIEKINQTQSPPDCRWTRRRPAPAARQPTVLRRRPRAWPCGSLRAKPSALYWNLQQTSYSSHPPIRLGTKHTQVQTNCLWKNNNYNNFVIRTTTLWCILHSASFFWFSIRSSVTLVGQKIRKTKSVY